MAFAKGRHADGSSPRAYASDATVSRGAVVGSDGLSAEEATFFWSRRKQKNEEMVKASPGSRDLDDFPAAVRPEQDSLLEHVILATPWHISASYRFRRHSHINVQEMLAYHTALRAAARRTECWRSKVSFFLDSQTGLALRLFCSLTPLALWIGTEENPADNPTRDPWRAEQAMDERASQAQWDASMGFPVEGHHRCALPVENAGLESKI
eukprot:5956723-Amphidinium_carterae.3